MMFQVLTEWEERSAVEIARNEPFSGWTKTFTDPLLCATIVDRPSDGAKSSRRNRSRRERNCITVSEKLDRVKSTTSRRDGKQPCMAIIVRSRRRLTTGVDADSNGWGHLAIVGRGGDAVGILRCGSRGAVGCLRWGHRGCGGRLC